MKIRITDGAAWYQDKLGDEFEVYEISEVGDWDTPEKGYVIDPPDGWQRYVSEFNCIVI